jgi:hypothetical protein
MKSEDIKQKNYDKKILVLFEFGTIYHKPNTALVLGGIFAEVETYQPLALGKDTEVIFIDLSKSNSKSNSNSRPSGETQDDKSNTSLEPDVIPLAEESQLFEETQDGKGNILLEPNTTPLAKEISAQIKSITDKITKQNGEKANIKLQFAFGGHGRKDTSLINDGGGVVGWTHQARYLDVGDLAPTIKETLAQLNSDPNIKITSQELIGVSCFAANMPEQKKGLLDSMSDIVYSAKSKMFQKSKNEPNLGRESLKKEFPMEALEEPDNAVARLYRELKELKVDFDKVKGTGGENDLMPLGYNRVISSSNKKFVEMVREKSDREHFLNPSPSNRGTEGNIIKFNKKSSWSEKLKNDTALPRGEDLTPKR